MNKPIIALVGTLIFATAPAWASETILTCAENGNDDVVNIRFDAAQKTFHLTGKGTWVVRKHGGEAVVKSVEFGDDKITVKFKKRGVRFLALGAVAAGAASSGTGILDRIQGTWTLGPHTYQCQQVSNDKRKF
jgi:hypothetical protein